MVGVRYGVGILNLSSRLNRSHHCMGMALLMDAADSLYNSTTSVNNNNNDDENNNNKNNHDFENKNLNETNGLSSGAQKVISVELYTVVIYFVVLSILVCSGIACNAAVIVAARCPGRPSHFRRRLVSGNLCAVQLIICILETPIGFSTTVLNYMKRPLPGFLCNANNCLFHALLSATVCGFLLLTVIRWRHMKRACGNNSEISTPDEDVNNFTTAMLLAGPWICAVAASLLLAIEFSRSMEFVVCQNAVVFNWTNADGVKSWRITPMLMLFNVFLLSICVAILTAIYLFYTKKFDRLRDEFCQRREQTILLRENGSEEPMTTRNSFCGTKKQKSAKDVCLGSRRKSGSRAGGGGGAETAGDDLLPTTGMKTVKGKPMKVYSDAEDNNRDDEDTFDTKMRLKFQKKGGRSSGRRHTVANIGLPDLGNLRRSSLENVKQKPTSPANNYLYVRKWSVDITALANQLENPKMHAGSYPTLRNTSPSGGSPCSGNEGESMELTSTGGEREGFPSGGAGKQPRFLPRLIEKGTPEAANATLEAPSIVVSLTPDTEAETMECSFESRSRLGSGDIEGGESSSHEKDGFSADNNKIIDVKEDLSEILTTTFAVLFTVALMLPCTIGTLINACAAVEDWKMVFNLQLIFSSLCLLQAVFIPVVLIRSDRELLQQLITIRGIATSLRCICYCNIRTGKDCIARKKHRGRHLQQI